LVSESASIGGIPLRLVDTAGIREAGDEVEAIGVERARRALADADLRLMVVDAAEGWVEEDSDLLEEIRPLGAWLLAVNKCDLPPRLTARELERVLNSNRVAVVAGRASDAHGAPAQERPMAGIRDSESPREFEPSATPPVVWTSAVTGEGIGELRHRILEAAAPDSRAGSEGEFITNLRHQQCLHQSLAALGRARQATLERVPHEMLLLDLYEALHSLDTVTGATTVDDVLGLIFSTFCVGK
jgi:tRNA modification GTPase